MVSFYFKGNGRTHNIYKHIFLHKVQFLALFSLFLGRSELLVDSRWRVINGFSLGAHQFGYIAPREKKLLARHLLDNLCKNM